MGGGGGRGLSLFQVHLLILLGTPVVFILGAFFNPIWTLWQKIFASWGAFSPLFLNMSQKRGMLNSHFDGLFQSWLDDI